METKICCECGVELPADLMDERGFMRKATGWKLEFEDLCYVCKLPRYNKGLKLPKDAPFASPYYRERYDATVKLLAERQATSDNSQKAEQIASNS